MNIPQKLHVLVIGSGGREHALVRAIRKSPYCERLSASPGNAGIAAETDCFEVAADDVEAIVRLARAEAVDLVIVGPEAALAAGLVDACEAAGIPAYGPTQTAARLESSKAFAKAFMVRHRIPTASAETFTQLEPALAYLRKHSMPVVIKASGLASGKGVIIAEALPEAEAVCRDMLEGGVFGTSGSAIVIEEYLEGEEVSVHSIVSRQGYLMLPPSQDHKRALDGDQGPNTGGMGACCPLPSVTGVMMELIERSIIEPTLRGLLDDGLDFRGTLYAGLMLTQQGPKVLEYNVRFGDPEAQVVLPLIEGDLLTTLYASATGQPLPEMTNPSGQAALAVVLAARGYPGQFEKGTRIELPAETADAYFLHAGTQRSRDGKWLAAGGRVLSAVGLGTNLGEAHARAYAIADAVRWPGKSLRTDIGQKQLQV